MLTAFNVRGKKGFNKEHGTSNLCAGHTGGAHLKAVVLELLCCDSNISEIILKLSKKNVTPENGNDFFFSHTVRRDICG